MTNRHALLIATATAVLSMVSFVNAHAAALDMQCINEVLIDADDSTTVGELRTLCRKMRLASPSFV